MNLLDSNTLALITPKTTRDLQVRKSFTGVSSTSALGELQITTPDGRFVLDQDINFGATGVEEVFQNVKYILLTEYFSVPLDREFGMDFSMVDKPIPVAEAMLTQEIAIKIALYESRCQFTDIRFDGSGIEGRLNPTVIITILSTDELPSRYPVPTGEVSIQLASAVAFLYSGQILNFPDFLNSIAKQGPPGPQGEAATVSVGKTVTETPGTPANVINVGNINDAVLDFYIPQGDKGDKGDQGTGVTIKGTVPDSTHLPTTGNTVGDVWIAADTGHGWSWDGTQWTDIGPIQGPPGTPGQAATITAGTTSTLTPGTPASVVNVGTSQNAVFDFGIPQGITGPTGQRGSIWFNGTTDPPATIPNSLPGDYYLNTVSGDVFLVS
jgi:phage baseplate assembly protein W